MQQPDPHNSYCEQIRIRGQVQGVGFRPAVYRIARELEIDGEVLNDGEGVLLTAQAARRDIDRFIEQLQQQLPALARIDAIERQTITPPHNLDGFRIVASQDGAVQTRVTPDAVTCQDCLADINDPDNRRYGYPFTNCTHCGPRLSIIRRIPYDRVNTSMAPFTQCPSCQREYDDPEDRRFHAQPNACPDCGPVLQILDRHGNQILCQDIIEQTVHLIQQGKIIAIKGIGGFQLACDAANDEAVKTLRRRKQRPAKALALMGAHLTQIERYCRVSTRERQELESSAGPIVVLQAHRGAQKLSQHLAPGQNSLGFMLPYSPLHHRLMQQLTDPIVLTSGNASEEPQCIDNQQALAKLGEIADVFLLHNRAIVNRIDDSVLRVIDNQAQFYRRARGYAPAPLMLPDGFADAPAILACGAELKNTFALLQHGHATLSQHMGNLENLQTYDDYLKNLELYRQLFEFEPQAIAVDSHPDYLASKYGRQLANELELPLIEIQHHHAHIAACLADNGWGINDGKVISIALDGLGYGEDGTIWGGEFLLSDYLHSERIGRLRPTPLPGGLRAQLEPWRNTLAQLNSLADISDLFAQHGDLELFHYLADKPWQTLQRMIDTGTNSPLSSSLGRLFDAVAAALGICRDQLSYEGQAAIELEALFDDTELDQAQPYPFELEQGEILQINPQPMWLGLLQDLHHPRAHTLIAARFHQTVAHMIVAMAEKLRSGNAIDSVALSGGVLQNPSLSRLLNELLRQRGFKILSHHQVPCNDGGIALGQAAIAAARINRGGL